MQSEFITNDPGNGEKDFGWLFAHYQKQIYGFIRSVIGHQADAEDVFQETASVMWQKFEDYQPGTNFVAWALSIARFRVMKHFDRKKRDRFHFSQACLDALATDTASESDRLNTMQDTLMHCLAKLPSIDRNLIYSYYQTSLGVPTIAKKLNRPASSVYDALNRVRKTLVGCVRRTMLEGGS